MDEPRRRGRPPRGTEGEVTSRILDAARQVFVADGFAGTSLDAIAAAAGISKRTFYTRFSSKSDLFEAVARKCIDEAFHPLEKSCSDAGTFTERLHCLALSMLANALTPEIAALERMLAAEAAHFPDLARRLNDLGRLRGAGLVERCLAGGIERGEFEIADVAFAAEFFVNAVIRVPMMHAMLCIQTPEMTFLKRDTLRRSVDLFLKGCLKSP